MADPTDYSGVLELRIHGVNNTSPASVLDLPPEAVERVLGDELAGFWREKGDAQARLADPADRGYRPPTLVREAYSWGGLARNTTASDGPGYVGTIRRGLSRAGWALVLPFGIANVAYWTRRLGGPGAGAVRLFGLALTALIVVSAAEVSMDLVATQCFSDDPAAVKQCERLPSAFNVLAGRDLALRLVLAAAAPLALLALLWSLSSVTRSRYERRAHGPAGEPADPPPNGILLSAPDFWRGDVMVGRLVRIHVAAGVGVVGLLLAWPGLFGGGTSCRGATSVLDTGGACWDQARHRDGGVMAALVLALALDLAVVAAAGVLACRTAGDAPDFRRASTGRDPTTWLLGAAAAALVWSAGTLAVARPAIDPVVRREGDQVVARQLLAVSAAPTFVMALLAALALAGFAVRGGCARWFAPAFTAGFVLMVGRPAVGVTVLVVAGAVLVVKNRSRPASERSDVAWSGHGPGVFLGLAAVAAVTLSSLAVYTAGNWLNGPNDAADMLAACEDDCAGAAAPHLLVALPYTLFGVGVLVALLLAGLVLAVALALTFPGGRGIGPAAGGPVPPGVMDGPVRSARRFAAAAHRAEGAIGLVVGLGLAAVVFATALSASGWPDRPLARHGLEGGLRKAVELGAYALGAVGLALLGALVGAGSRSRTRPLGLVWDLICFLPRAAHPFGPPCYAERTVPELVSRCEWWLNTEEPAPGPGRRGGRVVLSAHSLGSVLAVSTILALPDAVTAERQVRLLTYGTQIRAYFSRIFPELLGPAVLGIPACGPGRFWAVDPWAHEVSRAATPDPAAAGSVRGRLGPGGWLSLWRRTDYLGFPAWSYEPGGNPLDRAAEEVDDTGYLLEVVTHSNYPRCARYRAALEETATT